MAIFFSVVFLIISQPAYAYVGPGLGAGTIGAVLGIVGSICLALFAVIYYPIKRALKKWKARKQDQNTSHRQSTKRAQE